MKNNLENKLLKIAFQGEPGAYSETALLEFFNTDVSPVGFVAFDDVFDSVEKKECDYGFIPIENSLAGSIHRNYDLLREHNLYIIGETNLRIRHCLIAYPGIKKEEINTVISHPQALEQCRGYLRNFGEIKIDPVYDTAGAVKQLSENKKNTIAAIASKRAAEIYNMEILEEGIEDNPANFTRFLVLANEPINPGKNAKTSIVVSLHNTPGSLFKALSVFALRDIDLYKLESRPLIGLPGEYLFYIDFSGSLEDQSVIHGLNHLEEYATMLRILGAYPKYPEKNDTFTKKKLPIEKR
jgi:prephenate dehydratase